MNEEQRDPELKFVGVEWTAPPPSTEFHPRVLAAFDREFEKAPWWRRFLPRRGRRLLVGLLSSAALLFVVTQAYPQISRQSLPAGTKWTVDSAFVHYGDDGSESVQMISTSYQSNSNEVLVSRSAPASAFMNEGRAIIKTALMGTLDVVTPVMGKFVTPFVVDPETLQKLKRDHSSTIGFITGCDAGCLLVQHFAWNKATTGSGNACIDGPIVDRATILNHPTEAVRRRWTEHGRMTIWMAPDLACFALQVTYETELPDGSLHPVSAKHAVRLNAIP